MSGCRGPVRTCGSPRPRPSGATCALWPGGEGSALPLGVPGPGAVWGRTRGCCCGDQQPYGPRKPVWSPSAPSLLPRPRSELIQLVAVTQKTAERSYREHIEQQIQTYQRRWAPPRPPLTPRLESFTHSSYLSFTQSGSGAGECSPVGPVLPLLFNHTDRTEREPPSTATCSPGAAMAASPDGGVPRAQAKKNPEAPPRACPAASRAEGRPERVLAAAPAAVTGLLSSQRPVPLPPATAPSSASVC